MPTATTQTTNKPIGTSRDLVYFNGVCDASDYPKLLDKVLPQNMAKKTEVVTGHHLSYSSKPYQLEAREIFSDPIETFFKVKTEGKEFNLMTVGKLPFASQETPLSFTGICMFGSEGATFKNEHGEEWKIVNPALSKEVPSFTLSDLSIRPDLSDFEKEALKTIPSLLEEIQKSGFETKVLLPDVQYLLYLAEGIENGVKLDASLCKDWIEAVESRADLLKVGFGELEDSIYNPLSVVKEIIISALEQARTPDFNRVIDELTESNTSWSIMVDLKNPRTWTELIHLSYSFGMIDACLSDSKSWPVQFDFPHEKPVLDATTNIIDELNLPFRLSGIYFLEENLPKVTRGVETKSLFHF